VQGGKRTGRIVGKTIMGAVVSLDGFMADDNDGVGPLFDWLGNGDVAWSFPGSDSESRTTQASADFMLDLYGDMAANVIGRRVFDMTNGWNGKPAAGEHVFVVTHRPPTDWEYADTAPFTFVDGVEKAITAAKEFAGDRVVDVAAGQIGGQALRLGLIDQVVVDQVPVVFGPAARSSPPAAWPSRCGWRTRPRSCAATGSPTWSTTSAAEGRRPQRSGSPVRSPPTVASSSSARFVDAPGASSCVTRAFRRNIVKLCRQGIAIARNPSARPSLPALSRLLRSDVSRRPVLSVVKVCRWI